MAANNREIEIKLLVLDNTAYSVVNRAIRKFAQKICPEHEEISGNSYDLYWKASKSASADFVRLRRNDSGAWITAKATDRGDNIDRVEIDLKVDSYSQAKALLECSFPDAPVKIKKKYHVYFLGCEHDSISVYTVSGDPDSKVFVEVEARSLDTVKDLVMGLIENTNERYGWSKSSLFNLFVEEKGIKLLTVNQFLESV